MKSKVGRRKEIIKIRAEINEIESKKKMVLKVNETRNPRGEITPVLQAACELIGKKSVDQMASQVNFTKHSEKN